MKAILVLLLDKCMYCYGGKLGLVKCSGFLLFLFGIFLALGMFLLTADLLRLPRLATLRALLSVGRQEKKQARSVEALLMGWAIKLAPHIHMDEYKRGRLKNTLAAAGLNMTPEEYTAFAMV